MSDDRLAWTHPEMVRRYNLLVTRMWAKGWDVGITSSTRSYQTQREWYALYLRGAWPSIVADPERFYGYAPGELGGFTARGSMHEIQADGYSHALDIWWMGPRPDQFHNEAYMVGLHPVEPTESWHMQWWDVVTGVFTCFDDNEGDDDMPTAKEIATAMMDELIPVHDYTTGADTMVTRRVAEGYKLSELSLIRHHLTGEPALSEPAH